MDDGNAGGTRRGQESRCFRHGIDDARCKERRTFHRIGLQKVDHQKRRSLAEADAVAPNALIIGFGTLHRLLLFLSFIHHDHERAGRRFSEF